MSEKQGNVKRRNYFSYPKGQLRILVFLFCIALVYGVLNVYLGQRSLSVLKADVQALPSLAPVVQHDLAVLLDQHTATMYLQMLVFSLLVLAMVLMAGVLLSHRIGGPIGRMKRYMQREIDGKGPTGPLRFRRDDFFHDLADTFNAFREHQVRANRTPPVPRA